MDWVRPDGGDWTRFKAHPLVNWAHAIPVGRGAVEHKSLDFQGKSTVVAAGATEFFQKAADLDGIDRTEFDNPNDRTPVGEYSVTECLRAAEDAEALVRGNIATGVSIEFTPNGPKGSKPGEGAYWDLPGKSPLCPRPPRHFEHWNGHAYAHARMPVNPGCRTVLDDQAEVVEKAIRVAQTGRLPGGKPVHHLVLKAFRDAETLLPLVRGEGRGSTVRGEWKGETEAELETKAAADKPKTPEETETRAAANGLPAHHHRFQGLVTPGGNHIPLKYSNSKGHEAHGTAILRETHISGDNSTYDADRTLRQEAHQQGFWTIAVDGTVMFAEGNHAHYPAFKQWVGKSLDPKKFPVVYVTTFGHPDSFPREHSLDVWDESNRQSKRGTKSIDHTDIFAADLTIPVMEVRAGEDRSMFGPAATKAREASRRARNATADAGIPLKGSRPKATLKGGADPLPPEGSLGGATLRAHGHAHDGNYQLAARSHGRVGRQLREMAETLPDDHPRREQLHAAARAHEDAEDANLVAHSVVNRKTRMPGRPLISEPRPVDLRNPKYHAGPRSEGITPRPWEKVTSTASPWHPNKAAENALTASQNAYHSSSDRDNAETEGGHRELLTGAWRHYSQGRGLKDDRASALHHSRLASFHEKESLRLAQLGDTTGSYAHEEAGRLNRHAEKMFSGRIPSMARPPAMANHPTASFNYEKPSLWQRMTRPTGAYKAIPEHDTPEDDVATQSDYAKIANTASRLAFKMGGEFGQGRLTGQVQAKSIPEHRDMAGIHNRTAKSLFETNPKAAEAHERAAEMHRRAAGLEVKANGDDRTPAFASAGVDQPPAGVQALLNFAQLLVDGSTALGYDIQGSDDVDLRKYAKSLQVKAQDMAGELKALADKMASRLKAADNGKGDTGPHPLAEGAEQPDAEAKALDTRPDGSLVIKSYDNWTPRRFPLSALKTLPGGSNAVPTPATPPAPAEAPVVKSAEEKAKEALLKQRVEEELARAALLTKRFGEVVDALNAK